MTNYLSFSGQEVDSRFIGGFFAESSCLLLPPGNEVDEGLKQLLKLMVVKAVQWVNGG